MTMKHIILVSMLFLAPVVTKAQDTLRTHVTYDLATEMAVGSGDYTAFQLTANRHHVLATRPNTAYLRGAVKVEHAFNKDLRLSGAVDAIFAVHADHKAYLQQCYVNLSWKSFFIEAGSREQRPVLRDELLSSGSFIKGTNAKPIPQVHIGTNGFWTVPYTRDWLQINFQTISSTTAPVVNGDNSITFANGVLSAPADTPYTVE